MNSGLHRIVFNARRGQRIAVAETARSGGKAAAGDSTAARIAWLALSGALCAGLAQAQIVADPAAPGSQKPTVLTAPNAVPLINIQTPSAAGVSRNTYKQFDVNAQGAILNNSRGNVQTQLGGWVQGNPWLATGSARVILNEVNSSNPSQLRGWVEVAGQRAEVIVANPAGIAVDGAGFINASRVTLTTGTPVLNAGTLESFRVQGGMVSIDGAGLDLRDADATTILARAVQLNANLWAKDLKVVAGANTVSAATQEVVGSAPPTGSAPAFMLDVAHIGGMYAGKIRLVGTEAGLGVNNRGTLAASGGDLVVQANGWLTNTGVLQASAKVDAQVSASVGISGSARAGESVRLAGASIDAAGASVSAGNVDLIASSADMNLTGATVLAMGTLKAQAAQQLRTDAAILEAGQLALSASSLSNVAGSLVHTGAADLSLHFSGTLDNSRGRIASRSHNLSVSAATLVNSDGRVEHAGGGTLTLQANQLHNHRGQAWATNVLVVSAGDIHNESGRIAAGNLSVAGASLNNAGGQLLHTGTANAQVKLTGALDNTAGIIASEGALQLLAASLANQAGTVQSTQGGANLAVAGALNNRGGVVIATGDLTVTAASADNTAGRLSSAAGNLRVTSSGAVTNEVGNIQAALDAQVLGTGLSNAGGLVTARNITLDTAGGALGNRQGSIAAAGTASITGGALDNDRGLIQSNGALRIDTDGQGLVNTNTAAAGGIASASTVTLVTGALNNGAGFIGAVDTLSVTVAALDNRAGQVQALGPLTVDVGTGTLNNTAGLIRSAQGTTLRAGNLVNSNTHAAGQGIEGGEVSVTANAIANIGGAMRANNNLTITSDGQLTNTAGLLSAGHTATLQDSAPARTLAVTNTGGTLISGRAANVSAASLTGDGSLLSRGTMDISLASDFSNSAEVVANGNASLATSGNMTNSGKLQSGATLTVSGTHVDNTVTGEISAATTRIRATGTLTNRGLIDGSDTQIDAGSLQNIGTGRIYGTRLSVAGGSVTNAAETTGGVTTAATLAARERMDLGVGALHNRDHALIFSAGDTAIAGGLDSSRRANASSASLVNNSSATVEALGNLSIRANQITNSNQDFSTQTVQVPSEPVQEFQIAGQPERWEPSQVYTFDGEELVLHVIPTGQESYWVGFNQYDFTRTVTETTLARSDPAQLLAGGTITLNAGTVLNDKSRIIAGGTLGGSIGTLTNTDVAGERTSTDTGTVTNYYRIYRSGRDGYGTSTTAYTPAATVQALTLSPTVYRQNTAPTGTGTAVGSLSTVSVNQAAAATGTAAPASRAGFVSPLIEVPLSQSAGAVPLVVRTAALPATATNSSLFARAPDPASGYLIETDPRFADSRQWLSSDHLLSALGADPAATQKRLGDGFYEQRLVREQVAQLTGRRFLDGYADDQDQYRALMASGAAFAREWNLRPGVSLSAQQMAQLTSDIVWLVEQEVTLPDGSHAKALMPQVYVRVQEGDLDASGALLAGGQVSLDVRGDLVNSGTLAGRDLLRLTAENVHNLGGRIQAAQAMIAAREDLNNTDGSIRATQDLLATAGRDLNVVSTTRSRTNAQGTRTSIDRVAGLYVTAQGGTLVAAAGHDVNVIAGALASAGTLDVAATNDIQLGTVQQGSSNRIVWNGTNWRLEASRQDVGSQLAAGGAMRLQAGRDLSATAAAVSAAGDLTASAGRNVTLAAGQAGSQLEEAHQTTKKGLLRKQVNTTHSTVDETAALGTSLTGNNVSIVAGNDVAVQAGNVDAQWALDVRAANDIRIGTAQESSESSSRRTQTKTPTGLAKVLGVTQAGFSLDVAGAFLKKENTRQGATDDVTVVKGSILTGDTVELQSGRDTSIQGSTVIAEGGLAVQAGRNLSIESAQNTQTGTSESSTKKTGQVGRGVAFAVGSTRQEQQTRQTAVTQSASTVGSLGGDVQLQAGEQYRQTASEVRSVQGDVVIQARQVAIESAQNERSASEQNKASKKALGVSVDVPLVNAVKGVRDLGRAGGDTGNSRVQALAAATAAIKADQAIDSAKALSQGNLGGVKVTLSLSSSKSESQSAQTSSTAVQSAVSGRDVTITATGAGKDSHIEVTGSNITASRDATLRADGDVKLQAAANTAEQHSSNKSSGASIGIGYAMGGAQNGFTLEASASKARGNADGGDTVWTNSQVTAGNAASIQSGGDTTLKGAVVAGTQVQGQIGGNLNIESLQDTSTYDAKQSSSGINVSICVPPFCYGASSVGGSAGKARVEGDFASVSEHSGIKAGDGGFQVSVAGNTDLKGATITSSDQAAAAGSNVLVTGTLTHSDIRNRSEYEAKSFSLAGSVGFQVGDQSTATTQKQKDAAQAEPQNSHAPGFGHAQGSQSSFTRSGVSQGVVAITNEAGQKAATGQSAAEAAATLNRDVSSDRDSSAALTKTWDGSQLMADVQAQAKITEAALPAVAKEIGTEMGRKAADLHELARAEADPARQKALLEEAAKYDEGGAYRVAAHITLGALAGGTQGALGAGTASAMAGALNDWQEQLQDKLIDNGMSVDGAQGMAKLLTGTAATMIGGAAGGAAGAIAASNADFNNRQLHPTEKMIIVKLARQKAEQSCKPGDSACARAQAEFWSDAMERVAKGLVDDQEYDKNAAYLAQLVQASSDPSSQGAQGALQSYLAALQTAQKMLSPYAGQVITVNGQVASAAESAQTYFGATPAQQADKSGNYLLGMDVPSPVVPGMAQRDEERLAYFGANSGSATPVYPAEELLLGGAAFSKAAGAVARALGTEADVFFAGVTSPSQKGHIATGKMTQESLTVKLSSSEMNLLKQIDALPSVQVQGALREYVADSYFLRNGYVRLEGKCGGGNCFDGVYVKGRQVVVNEVKPLNSTGSVSLSGNSGTSLGTQMSDIWVNGAVQRLKVSGSPDALRVAKLIEDAAKTGTLTRVVSGVGSTEMKIVKISEGF